MFWLVLPSETTEAIESATIGARATLAPNATTRTRCRASKEAGER